MGDLDLPCQNVPECGEGWALCPAPAPLLAQLGAGVGPAEGQGREDR